MRSKKRRPKVQRRMEFFLDQGLKESGGGSLGGCCEGKEDLSDDREVCVLELDRVPSSCSRGCGGSWLELCLSSIWDLSMILRGDICSFPDPATGANSCVDPINADESFGTGIIAFSLLFEGLGRWTIKVILKQEKIQVIQVRGCVTTVETVRAIGGKVGTWLTGTSREILIGSERQSRLSPPPFGLARTSERLSWLIGATS
jgi:hypothetical protein